MAISLIWAVRVPFFQMPDEVAHADYAFAFFDAGVPFRLQRSGSGNYVMPQTRFLMKTSDYRQLRYNRYASVPEAAGTHTFLRGSDRNTPAPSGHRPKDGATLPYAMSAYPPLYYIEIAAIMRVAWNVSGHSLFATFFAARFFNVALLAFSLFISYRIFIEFKLDVMQRLLLLTAIGLLPITSWLHGYVQPDNQSELLVGLGILITLMLRHRSASIPIWFALLGTGVALAATKPHYAVVLVLSSALSLRGVLARRHPVTSIMFVTSMIVPLALALAVRNFVPAGAFGAISVAHAYERISPLAIISINATNFAEYFWAMFAGGLTFQSFWSTFDLRGRTIFGQFPTLDLVVTSILLASTAIIATVVAAQQLGVARRLWQIARRKGIWKVVQFLANDVVLNAYVLLTLLLFSVSSITNGLLVLQGRYWYPVAAAVFAFTLTRVARSFPRRQSSHVLTIFCGLFCAYSAVASPVALSALQNDFYTSHGGAPKRELGEITHVFVNGLREGAQRIRIHASDSLSLSGVALDSSLGLPAEDVEVRIDSESTQFRAHTNLNSDKLVDVFNDPLLRSAGFEATVPIKRLGVGTHRITFLARERRAPEGLPFAHEDFEVVP